MGLFSNNAKDQIATINRAKEQIKKEFLEFKNQYSNMQKNETSTAINVEYSDATTIASLRSDFNKLIDALKDAGIIEKNTEQETSIEGDE